MKIILIVQVLVSFKSGRVEFYSGNFSGRGICGFDKNTDRTKYNKFYQGSREGILLIITNNNHLNLQLNNTPKWSVILFKARAYEFGGINDSIKLPKEVVSYIDQISLYAIVKSNGLADNILCQASK